LFPIRRHDPEDDREGSGRINCPDTLLGAIDRWQLQGKTLRLTLTKPGCRDEVAQTIPASEPWTRR